jgi:aspartate-semialdehyde dehydrogenase
VPVEVGHSISATVELDATADLAGVRAALQAAPGVILHDSDRDPLPRDIAGSDEVRAGHLRVDPDLPHVLHLWIVADNLRKGAATNAVQIAELLTRHVPQQEVQHV